MPNSNPIQTAVFAVLNEPYCLWDVDIKARNLEFLNGIDAGYFDFVGQSNLLHLEDEEEKQRAAVGIRLAYYHGMETLFSLIGALLQAPKCVYAWIAKYQVRDIRSLIKMISERQRDFLVTVKIDEISWDRIGRAVHASSNPDSAKARRNSELFGEFWARLAADFLEENNRLEYNSIKHGFRVRSGSFALYMGLEKQYGVPAPPENMELVGQSNFGSTFYVLEGIGENSKGNRSVRSRQSMANWSAEGTFLALQLISMSIGNLISTLKIMNGVPASEVKYTRPSEDHDFERPWEGSPSLFGFNMDYVISEDEVRSTTKKELLKMWDQIETP